jgi:hypothetical protein
MGPYACVVYVQKAIMQSENLCLRLSFSSVLFLHFPEDSAQPFISAIFFALDNVLVIGFFS